MDRYENNVSAAVHEFYDFMDAASVVLHLYQATEYAHTVVYMDHIVSKIEGAEVVEGELLCLFNAAADPYTVEAVEYFMVCIYTDFVFLVYVSGMYVLFLYEFRKDGVFVLKHDGAEAFKLGLLFTYYINFVPGFPLSLYVGNEKLEILVENGLRGYFEGYRLFILAAKGKFHVYLFEG